MTRGIYLVANKRSERESAHLIYSLRKVGCTLPIVLIPYDDNESEHPVLRAETTRMRVRDFPAEGQEMLARTARLWPETSSGLFRRFLSFYGPFDEFIYSDNDIVALGDWTELFDYLGENDVVHADYEFTTEGKFNYKKPVEMRKLFGPAALDSVLTAGHFVGGEGGGVSPAFAMVPDWVAKNPGVAFHHDQAYFHLAILLAGLRTRNMCRAPDNWPSTWAGDYANALAVVQTAQKREARLMHLHYSGWPPDGYHASEELYFSNLTDAKRFTLHLRAGLWHLSGLHYLTGQFWRGLKRRSRKFLGKN